MVASPQREVGLGAVQPRESTSTFPSPPQMFIRGGGVWVGALILGVPQPPPPDPPSVL